MHTYIYRLSQFHVLPDIILHICTHTHTHTHTHIHTYTGIDIFMSNLTSFHVAPCRYSVYLLYGYKSTNTDAEGAAALTNSGARSTRSFTSSHFSTQFTRFTGTKEQILTQKALQRSQTRVQGALAPSPQFTCFTSTKVRILTQQRIQRA